MSALPLAALQQALGDHVLGRDVPALASACVDGRIPAAARLRIYRHHVISSLTAALGATFSTVRGVVGEAFFAAMARAFILSSPPMGPVLAEYGRDFPGFVADWPAAAGLPYLGDVARLDWALNLAYHAPAAPALTATQLAGLPPERLAHLRPGLRAGVSLVASDYPIQRIWALNHGGGAQTVDLETGGVTLLVFPRSDDAAFAELDGGVACLAAALRDGLSLGQAADRVVAAYPDRDAGAALGRLLALEALAGIG